MGTLHPKGRLWASMPPATRTMRMCSRVMPGVMPGAFRTPPSTMHNHFQYEEELQARAFLALFACILHKTAL